MPRDVLRDYDGWRNNRIYSGRDAFVHYAKNCFESFGDIVADWVTFQEPQRELIQSYENNAAPPLSPINIPGKQVYENAKNIILAHAEAVQEYRNLKLDGRIGIALSTDFALPFDELLESDVIAADNANIFHIDWLLNPLLTGDWPTEMKDAAGSRLPGFTKTEELKAGYLVFAKVL